MVPRSQGFSPSYDRLHLAIDRFLAGKITPIQLQSWCYAHFDHPEPAGKEREQRMWQLTLAHLAMFHRCDVPRADLEQSLALLQASMETTGMPCVTPMTASDCWYEMQRRDRQERDRY